MADQSQAPDFDELIPELRLWNDGAGVTADSWIFMMGNYELAIGYSLVFWPRFVVIDDHVVREGATLDSLRAWQEATDWNPVRVEAVMNHIHMVDIHGNSPDPSEAQLRYLGRVLKTIHEVKLRVDFPDRTFVVDFNDEPDIDPVDYELTFWQPRE